MATEGSSQPIDVEQWPTPPVRGAIPRVQHTRAHAAFLDAVRPPMAMINIVHVRRLLKNGETAGTYFPDATTVITTTTVEDNKLAKIRPSQEAAMIRAFGPDFHIPADWPVYGNDDAERRLTNTKRVAAGTLDLRERLPEAIELIPLIKGTTPQERQYCERAVLEVEAPLCAYYATQQFTVPGNRQFYGVRDDLEAIATEMNGFPVLVIGFMSPSDSVPNREQSLRGLPDTVVAASGLRSWVSRVTPRETDPGAMQAAYRELHDGVGDALGSTLEYAGAEGASTSRS